MVTLGNDITKSIIVPISTLLAVFQSLGTKGPEKTFILSAVKPTGL